MYSDSMLPYRQTLLYLFIFTISFLSVRSNTQSTKFNITIKTPGKTSPPTETPHKSVHLKYTVPNDEDQWTIVGFEPEIQAHNKAVEQLTVHLCDSRIYQSIWYDDNTICDNEKSILIYGWTPYSSLSPFHISDDHGFEFNKSKSIILTVIYKKEKRAHIEQSGIILYISTLPIRFQMGTILAGNQQKGIHFSCRSSNLPRLIYGVKKLNFNKKDAWWRIHIIRVRQFGRKLVEKVFDSQILTNRNHSNVELVSPDLFLMTGDYLLIECDNISQGNCYFLIYYTYKSKLIKNDNTCENDDFPNLFKLIPSRGIFNKNQTTTNAPSIDGSTILLIVCILLLIIWISIIAGCIIMRRIRGLVNYRTEPSSPSSSQKNKLSYNRVRSPHDQFQRTGDADHIVQLDAEHGGHM